jgi:hypothetical protein
MTLTRKTPSELTKQLINMGYGAELSAPYIANTYLRCILTGERLPKTWEKSTVKDVNYCYYH